MGIKAQILTEKKCYGFSKSYLGSYRDFVPDYYRYGYQMVSFARYKYGKDIWSGALDYVGTHPYMINPLHIYLHRETGTGKQGLYQNTMEFLKEHWVETAAQRKIEDPVLINRRNNQTYTSWKSPRLLPDSSIIAVKSGLDFIQTFVRVYPGGRETRLFTPGRLNSGRIDVHGTRIVWDEFVNDVRWGNRSYSILREYNFENGKSRTITRKSRFSSPAYSLSGDTIITVETTLNNIFNLVFVSPADGKILARVPSPGNIQLQSPVLVGHTGQIAAVGVEEHGKRLLLYDPVRAEWKDLLPVSFVNISDPEPAGDYIVFNGSFEGVDDIYAINLKGGRLKKVTDSRFGAFEPSVDEASNQMAWADYTSLGYNVALRKLDSLDFSNVETKKPITEQPFFSYGDSSARHLPPFVPSSVDSLPQARSYSRAGHLFHFHSWSPFWFDYTNPNIDHPSVSPGITLLSQNLLSTAVTSIGYEYRAGENYLHTNFIYKGWVPVIDLSASYGGFPSIYLKDKVPLPTKVNTNMTYALKTYVPLSFNTGKIFSGAQPSLRISYSGSYFYSESKKDYKPGVIYVEPRLYLYGYLRPSVRDIQPRMGLTLDGSALTTPADNTYLGSWEVYRTSIYLPGIMKHDGLKASFAYQKQHPRIYHFLNSVSFPRGYSDLIAHDIRRFSLDYVFPVAYPDMDIAGIFFLKRIRADLFADIMQGKSIYRPTENGNEVFDATYRSFGAEFYIDYHVFRLLFPLESGIRISYLQNEDRYTVEGIFSVNLGAF